MEGKAVMTMLPKEIEEEDFVKRLRSRRYSGVTIQDKYTVPEEEIVRLWEHATSDTKRVRDYILSVGGKVDKSNNQQAALINEMVKNIRFEEEVIYKGNTGPSESFPSMVIKVEFIDKDRKEFYCLLYLPLDYTGPGRATSILFYIDLESIYVLPEGYQAGDVQYIKLAQPTDNLSLFYGNILRGIQHTIQNNTPTWLYGNMNSLWNMGTPYVDKLEIYLPEEIETSDKLFSKIQNTYKGRYNRLEIAQWNKDLNDYSRFAC